MPDIKIPITMQISTICLRCLIIFKMLSTIVPVTYCCSSRFFRFHETTTIPPTASSPPSPSTIHSASSKSSSRKNTSLKHRVMSEKDSKFIDTIMHLECSKEFEKEYCLHGGRCFNYTVANYSQPSCECREGYMGERCEVKYYSMYYPLNKTKIRIASVCFSAAAVSIFSTFLLYYCQNRCINYFIKPNLNDH